MTQEHDGAAAPTLPRRVRPMRGRDPHEHPRAATPLELLFDLAFVVAFGRAGDLAADLVAEEGLWIPAVLGFAFAMFSVCWAWINFTWFASAFDTDDWVYRLTTMVQMIGVVVLALGLPAMFHSIADGDRIHNEVMVAGYVVMRLAMLVQWLRAAREAPQYRATCLTYARALVITQVGWILLALAPVGVATFFAVGTVLVVAEMAGPKIAERVPGGGDGLRGTPWHAHHIAERYGLLAIITLGEGVIGTVASLSAVVQDQGWTLDAVLVVVAGIGLTFGLWWTYYTTPTAELLHRHRERSFAWGYGQIVVFAALAATGAGLHVVSFYLLGESHADALSSALAVAVPVLVFVLAHYVLLWVLARRVYRLDAGVVVLTVAVLGVGAFLATASMTWGLIVVMLAPAVSVVAHETGGHRRLSALLDDGGA